MSRGSLKFPVQVVDAGLLWLRQSDEGTHLMARCECSNARRLGMGTGGFKQGMRGRRRGKARAQAREGASKVRHKRKDPRHRN